MRSMKLLWRGGYVQYRRRLYPPTTLQQLRTVQTVGRIICDTTGPLWTDVQRLTTAPRSGKECRCRKRWSIDVEIMEPFLRELSDTVVDIVWFWRPLRCGAPELDLSYVALKPLQEVHIT